MQQFTHWFIYLLPVIMLAVFVMGATFRALIYYTVKRHEWFAREFEKRVDRFIDDEIPGQAKPASFYVTTKRILERTYFEVFEVRDRMNRRKHDRVMTLTDRIFLVKQGSAWLVKDILKQVKFLKWTNEVPHLLNITKSTFHHNPCFNRVFGLIPISGLNDFLTILPGLFVVAGILGTFLGIRGGLGSLGGMNLADLQTTKATMDTFLHEIAFAMASSIVGISFSLVLHVWNTFLNPERAYVAMIDRFESSLNLVWYRCDNNNFPTGDPAFDENKDPSEALAEEALNLEISKSQRRRDLDEVRKTKAS